MVLCLEKTNNESFKEFVARQLNDLKENTNEISNTINQLSVKRLLLLLVISICSIFLYYLIAEKISSYISELQASFLAIMMIFIIPTTSFLFLLKNNIKDFFGTFTKRELGITFLVAAAQFVLINLVLLMLSKFNINLSLEKNPITDLLEKKDIILVYISSIFQLFGENIIFTIFLFLFFRLFNKKVSLFHSILLSLCGASILFGIIHLPTYDYNWIQCIFIIGLPSSFHMLAYILFKNIFLSYFTHLFFDYMVWTFVILHAFS